MSDDDKQRCFSQAFAIFPRMLSKGKPVAFEDAIKPIATPEEFDRRGFGWIPAALHRDGEIVPVGFRESTNTRHHCGPKRLWVLAPSDEKGAANV